MFRLDDRLESSSFYICRLQLCEVRLVNDANYPWLLLVPQLDGIKDVIDLSAQDQALLWQESSVLSGLLKALHKPDKLNVASLGNVVAQCHVHHIARWENDVAWPDPVWGKCPATPYTDELAASRIGQYTEYLQKTQE